jgi:hypothetical protein
MREALQIARSDQGLEVRRLHAPQEGQGPHDVGVDVSHSKA